MSKIYYSEDASALKKELFKKLRTSEIKIEDTVFAEFHLKFLSDGIQFYPSFDDLASILEEIQDDFKEFEKELFTDRQFLGQLKLDREIMHFINELISSEYETSLEILSINTTFLVFI